MPTRAAGVDPSRDPSVAGSPAATLLEAFRAEPRRGFRAAVVGPGGSGKSALLAALAAAAWSRGLTVAAVEGPADVPDADADAVVLLVDDAHRLAPGTLERLTEHADDPCARLVVASRPDPTSAGLAVLLDTLDRVRPTLTLGPLDPDGVRCRVAAILGRPSPALADRVRVLTAGVPVLVDRLTAAVRADGAAVLDVLRVGGPVPAGVGEVVCAALDAAGEPVGRLLTAVAVGATTAFGAPDAWPAADPDGTDPDGSDGARVDTAAEHLATGIVGRAATAELLGVTRSEVDELAVAARAAGLLLPDGEVGRLAPLVRRVVEDHRPDEERWAMGRAVAGRALARGEDVLGPARVLSGSGLRGRDLARLFVVAGDEALVRHPEIATVLYGDAAVAGAPVAGLRIRRAAAAVLDADLDGAVRLADPVTTASDPSERAGAIAVVAAVLAHRGLTGEAADLLADPVAGLGRLAVPGMVATGHVQRARELRAAVVAGSSGSAPSCSTAPALPATLPATLRSVQDLVADGMLASVDTALDASPGTAVSHLTRAATLLEPVGAAVVLPDSPAALAALVAIPAGEVDVADSVLRRALASGLGGRGMVARHRLLRAWVALIRGDLAGLAVTLGPALPARLEPRDELLAAALEIGSARRRGDVGALRAAWPRAREACLGHPVDLTAVGPLGEIAVGAARLGESGILRHVGRGLEDLMARLGEPPLWRTTVSWSLHTAATLAEDPSTAQRHAERLADVASYGDLAAALATAARTRTDALAGRVDAAQTQEAAHALHRRGWTWDAARLAGEAAIRTTDRKDMAGLLACARAVRDPGTPAPGDPAAPPEDVALSEREREVAVLVLAGLTYKQIGTRLYISAKTVEHHVARMRKRLSSDSRDELFARLRDLVGDTPPSVAS